MNTCDKQSTVTIYIPLLDEGTPTIRATQAIDLGSGLYKVLPTPWYDPEDETWAYLPGSVVRCEMKRDYEGENILQAAQKI